MVPQIVSIWPLYTLLGFSIGPIKNHFLLRFEPLYRGLINSVEHVRNWRALVASLLIGVATKSFEVSLGCEPLSTLMETMIGLVSSRRWDGVSEL